MHKFLYLQRKAVKVQFTCHIKIEIKKIKRVILTLSFSLLSSKYPIWPINYQRKFNFNY